MYILQEYHWYGESYAKKIVAVDSGIPENLIDECKQIAFENKIFFYKKNS